MRQHTGQCPAQVMIRAEEASHFSTLVQEKTETKAPAKPGLFSYFHGGGDMLLFT